VTGREVTRGRRHVGRGAGVEVPVGGARRVGRRANGGESLVKSVPVAAVRRGRLVGHHGLLWLEGWSRT